MTGDVRLSVPVLELLTRWASRFEGKCPHPGRQQYGRPRDLRSGCVDCAAPLDVWGSSRPCDLCERPCHPEGVWSLPAEETGGVQMLMTVCDRCDVHSVDVEKEDEMTMTTSCCEMCRSALRAERLPAEWRYHDTCLRAVAGRAGALVAGGAMDSGEQRRVRARAVRARLAGRRPA